jgi:hypothetical protein
MSESLFVSQRCMLVLAGILMTTEVDARIPVVAVGEVTASDAHTATELRTMVSEEIQRLDVARATNHDRYVFSAAVVRLEASPRQAGARASSVVSGTLRKAGSGAIVAVTRGSARAEDEHGTVETVRSEALAAAVHGAVRRVSEAL